VKALRLLGALSSLIAYPFIASSIALSPWFNTYRNALSDLGNIARNSPVAFIYNLGLIITGLLASSFALLVSIRCRSRRCLGWSIPLLAASVDLSLIGFFPEDAGAIHGVVSVAFFTLIILTMLAYSACSLRLGSRRAGVAAALLAASSIAVWTIRWPWRGVAIQETAAALMASALLMVASLNKHMLPDGPSFSVERS
jgi:hypothetical membrane protein